eukprot:4752370-Pleurochrysis_carterae.AAC.1
MQTLSAVQHRAGFHPLLRTLSSMRVHLPSYAGQLQVMQTDGSPPASDRLKSFTLDSNELAKLLAFKLADLDLIDFGVFAAEASRRGKLMVKTNFERCLKSGEYLFELAEFGHRFTVGFGWSPHDGSGLTYRSFLLELHHFYKLGRSIQGAEREAHLKHLLTYYRDTLNFAGDAAKAKLLSSPDSEAFGALVPSRDPPALRLLRSYEARREHMDDTRATITPSAQLVPVHALLHAVPDASHFGAGNAARRAAQQLRASKEAPGSKAHLVRYDGDVVSIGNDTFSINALRHKLGNDICLPVALSRKTNPLAVCDCYGQPGHGELGHGAHKISRSARAVADAARLRSNNRLKPQTADGERTFQRQRQARAGGAADAHRLGELGELVRAVLESRNAQTATAHPPTFQPTTPPHLPPHHPAAPILSPLQQPVGKGKGRGGAGRGRGRGDAAGQPFTRARPQLTLTTRPTPLASSPLHWLACRAARLPVFAASFFLAPAAPVVLLLCVASVTPMRFLVRTSGDRMFGFAREGGESSLRTLSNAGKHARLEGSTGSDGT